MGLLALRENLVTRPRESSGSRSANRFDFQRDWSLCHLLELHGKGDDYVMVFEHHDDLVTLDSETDPQKIKLVQVKTKDTGLWRLADLLRRKVLKKQPGLSIIGKMYDHKRMFGDQIESLTFLSNVGFDVKKDGDVCCKNDTLIHIKELCAEHVNKINAQICTEHGVAGDPDFTPIAFLVVTDLSLQGHSEHAKGKLVTFIEKNLPETRFPPGALYKALFEEIKRKGSYEGEGLTYENLMVHKSISRAFFTELLNDLPDTKDFEAIWQTVNTQLTAEGMPFNEIMTLRNECRRYELERFNRANNVLVKLRSAVQQEAKRLQQPGSNASLRQMLGDGVVSIQALKLPGAEVFGREYLMAMFVLALYGY